MEAGNAFPPWDNQPRLTEERRMIRDAWGELDTCREHEMGQIPWTAIDRYAEREGVIEPERFRVLIRQMDREYLRAESERMKERLKQRGG